MTNFDKVKEFHTVYDCLINQKPVFPEEKERQLRIDLLREEFEEYLKAEKENNLIEVADALGDMLYIIYGTAVSYGIPINDVFAEIHRSNLSKLGDDGKPIRRTDGKVLKGPKYFRPDISGVLENTK